MDIFSQKSIFDTVKRSFLNTASFVILCGQAMKIYTHLNLETLSQTFPLKYTYIQRYSELFLSTPSSLPVGILSMCVLDLIRVS